MKTSSTETTTPLVQVRLRDFGDRLLTRDQGHLVRKALRERLARGENLQIDFEGVEVLSPSFADESIGRLLLEMGHGDFRARVRLRTTSETMRRLVNHVLRHRASQGHPDGEGDQVT